MRSLRLKYSGGFTLIELMVTVSVAAVLMAIAVPAYRSFQQNDRLLTEAFSLRQSLDLARAEAIKEDASVSVCASSDALTCNSNNWSNGWVVLSSAGGAPLLVAPPVANGNSITEQSGFASVVYQSAGITTLPATAKFTLCDSRGASSARYLEVSAMGRAVSPNNIGVNLAGVALNCP